MSKKINHCGLKNRGNTCFMNTFLQCLMSIPELNSYFLSDEYMSDFSRRVKRVMEDQRESDVKNLLITREYGNMLQELHQNKVEIFDPKAFHEFFQKLHPQFQGLHQQDSTEALTLVLDAFHESLKHKLRISYKGSGETPDDFLMISYVNSIRETYKTNYSKIYDLFNADIMQTVICKEHGRDGEELSRRFEPYMMTLLEIPHGATDLYDCFEEFFCDESLDEENLYFDEKSKSRVKSDIRKRLIHTPEYLIIALKRFKQYMGGHYQKNSTPIALPYGNDLLDLSEYTVGYDKDEAVYDLHAIGLHSGDMGGGHYYAYCKNPDNDKFYEYNDRDVSEIRLKERESDIYRQGYLFIYKKYTEEVNVS